MKSSCRSQMLHVCLAFIFSCFLQAPPSGLLASGAALVNTLLFGVSYACI